MNLSRVKKHAPLLIALGVALTFSTLHIIIEAGAFEYGPLSKKGLIHLFDLKSLDIKFMTRDPKDFPPPRVVIAAIDEKGVEKYGLWPWSRRVVGEFITKASEQGAKVIGFDAVFSDEDKNSSYLSVKRFVDAYDTLRPDVGTIKALQAQVDAAEKSFAETKTALAAFEGRLADVRAPARNALTPAFNAAKKAHERSAHNLEKARASLDEVRRQSAKFYELMSQEVASISPDEALAKAIAGSPQTVLGYFNFYNPAELVGVTKEEAERSFERLEKSAIRLVFEQTDSDLGKQTAPVEGLDISQMQIRPAIGARAPLPIFAKNATAFGYFNADLDPDGPIRRVRLFNRYKDTMYPALSLAAVAKYHDSVIRPLNGLIRPDVTIEGVAAMDPANDEIVPTSMQGHLLLNFYGNPESYFPRYSVADIIDGNLPKDALKDKIVLFGMTAQGLFDMRPTPFSPTTPGVYVHAVAAQNMLDGLFMKRDFGQALTEVLGYLLLGLLMGLVLPRVPAWAGVLATAAFAVGLYMIDLYILFPSGTWMYNILPTLQAVMTLIGVTVWQFLTEGKEKRQIRKAFQFYLTKSVVDQVLADPSKLKLGGEKKNCTVLFSDVRGFTTISERLSPEALVALLNSYLTPMTDIVYKYNGTLDKYIGDAIMAIFGAPVDQPDHATRACYVCLEMMDALGDLRKELAAKNLPDIDIGIGLNSGWVSAGNMGSSQRFDYTVMGDNVNLASRLEGINKQYGTNIIISESTYQAAKENIHVREVDLVRVKGKKEPVKIYELLGKGAPNSLTASLITEFDRAVQLYRRQQWDEAVAVFEMVKKDIKEGDYCSEMYIERCLAMKAAPPGQEWDGVYTMTTK